MAIKLSAVSLANLKGVHPDLVKVVLKAATMTPPDLPWEITEGMRSVAQQKANVAKGVSWTMNSRHLTGHAIDARPRVDLNHDGKITTSELYAWPLYYRLAPIFKAAAKAVGVPIVWGGDWKKNKDGPHFELDRRVYPAARPKVASLLGVSSDTADIRAYNEALDSALAEPYEEPETENWASGKASSTAAAGTASGVAVGYDPALDIATGLSTQQYELTSGDVLRIVLAVVIVGLSIWGAYKMAKGQGA